MLPFSSFDFFIISGIIILYLYFSKLFLKKFISYSTNLLLVSLFYLLFFYPEPWHIISLVIYSYLIYYLFNSILRFKNKLIGTIILLLPMILVKTDIRFHFYPFELNSFISFAGLSYISFRIVSVYIEAVPGSKAVNFFKYANFLIFIPTILIGPIDRYQRFNSDVNEGYNRINKKNFLDGWQMLILGILYKYICAEVVDRYWLEMIETESTKLIDMGNAMYAYFFYLFFDFAGYSAMAIGIGNMMGINVPINFNKPFLSINPQDFWRRFHKSLGDWLKDYFFMPLYMYFSRKKSLKKYPLLRQNTALFLTFLLMGLWNGFQLNFIISGMLFGLYSAVHNSYIYYCRKKRKDIVFNNLPENVVKWISIFIMVNLAAFSIYIFSGMCPFI